MLGVNRKNYYITWRINVRLKWKKSAKLTKLNWLTITEYSYVIINLHAPINDKEKIYIYL